MNKNKSFDKDGSSSGCVPLKHIFGFCKDYNHILINCSQLLALDRNMLDLGSLHYTSVEGKHMMTKLMKKIEACKSGINYSAV